MKKNILISLAWFAFNTFICAQKTSVVLSEEQSMKSSDIFGSHLFSDETGHYVYNINIDYKIASVQSFYEIIKFDHEFNEIWSQYFFEKEKKTEKYGINYINNKFLILHSNTKKKLISYYFLPVDFQGQAEKKIEVAKLEQKKSYYEPEVSWYTSKDDSKIGVSFISNNGKESNFEVFFKVFDATFNEVWSNKFLLEKPQEQILVLDQLIDENGNIYFLVKEYETKKLKEGKKVKGKKNKVPGYKTRIYCFKSGENSPRFIDLDLGTKFVKGTSLGILPSGEVNCVGMYSNLKNGNANGVFSLSIDQDGKTSESSLKEFSSSQLKLLGRKISDEDKKGKTGIEKNFRFKEQVVLDDGSMILTAEGYSSRVSESPKGHRSVLHYSKDIIVINIESDGVVSNLQVIPKKQVTYQGMFISHKIMPIEGKGTYFIYNDDADNMKLKLTDNPRRMNIKRGPVIASTYLGNDGKTNRSPVLDKSQKKYLIIPSDCKKIGPNQMFFTVMKPQFGKNGKYKFGVLTFE